MSASGKLSPSQLSDRLLSEAGLKPRWQPKTLPNDLLATAEKVLSYADKQALTTAQKSTVIKLGTQVISTSRQMLGFKQGDSFRAATAIDMRSANCIAISEVVCGVLARSGLGKYSLCSWDRRHAAPSLLIAGLHLGLDGTGKPKFIGSDDSSKRLLPVIGGEALITDFRRDGDEATFDRRVIKLNELDSVDTGSATFHSLYVPGPMAVPMFCGMQAQDGNPNYEHARQVLMNYAPVH